MAPTATLSGDPDLLRCRSDLDTANAKIVNLETALETSRTIGCAVGVLMALRKVSYERAFDLLREESQKTKRKIRDLAEEVVESGAL